MKKFIAGLLCGAALMLSTSALADGVLQQITAYLTPDISVEIDGQKIELQNVPVNYADNIYLPVRELAGAIGLVVGWDNETRTAKLHTPIIADVIHEVKIEEDFDYYKGSSGLPSLIIGENRYLPSRDGAEKYGFWPGITYDSDSKTVLLKEGWPLIHIDSIEANNPEAFIYLGTTYIREDLFLSN
ncbi:stalk domain-containing protein [Paenibacillus sp. YN15]|uniref:stalk domain-containing protein n=1 Tax=Paenibacillus sp. YN15 TaxID=1742774 RepID=UPI000DCDADF3|nr:stalk domain-containing protein [Paenibacillus sp. YN15]RAV05421.1 hypothetical protein DQG13_02010 [Paenibacillus sp. YN15]